MKRHALLLLPLMICLTSCISFANTPQGSEFIPNSSQTSETPLQFYDGLGDEIDKTGPASHLLFRNELSKSNSAYDLSSKNQLLDDINGDKEIISDILSLNRVYKGPYGLKLEYLNGKENEFSFSLTKKFHFMEVICSASFTNSLNYETGESIFETHEAAINVNNSKYVKLAGEKQDSIAKAKEFTATFNLGEQGSDTITFNAKLHSVIIYEINLY